MPALSEGHVDASFLEHHRRRVRASPSRQTPRRSSCWQAYRTPPPVALQNSRLQKWRRIVVSHTGEDSRYTAAPGRFIRASFEGCRRRPPSQPRSGVIVKPGGVSPRSPGASESLVALLVLNPSGVTWNGSRRGAGAIRCRPRWGLEKLHARRFLGLTPQALRFRPISGAAKTMPASTQLG